MQISLAAEALAHVRAAKDVLRKHPLEAAGRHWYRALGALAEAEQELQEGQELVLARLEDGAGCRVAEATAGTNADLPRQES
jgi:hypothetical protein